MKTALKILKINFLSILTLILYLIAFLGKTLEVFILRFRIVKYIIILVFLDIAVYEAIYYGIVFIEAYLYIIIAASMCCIVALVFSLARKLLYIGITIVYALLIYIWYGLIILFNKIYVLCYSGALNLTNICINDFQYICLTSKKIKNAFCCIFYYISQVIKKLIKIISLFAIIISVVFSGFCIIIFEQLSNKYFTRYYNKDIFNLIKEHNNPAAIAEITALVIIIIGIFAILISVGYDLHMWAKEQSKPIKLGNFNINEDEEIPKTQDEEFYIKYRNIFYNSIEDIGILSDEIDKIYSKNPNTDLIIYWNEYLNNVDELYSVFDSFNKRGKVSRFEIQSLIPKIRNIENQHEDIINRINEQKKRMANPFSEVIFFSGCNTLDKLERRHKILCKAYHPDVGGDETTFKKMQSEYEKLKSVIMKQEENFCNA